MFLLRNKKNDFQFISGLVILGNKLYPRYVNNNVVEGKIAIFSYISVLIYVLDAQNKRLIETFLLSTYIICFG